MKGFTHSKECYALYVYFFLLYFFISNPDHVKFIQRYFYEIWDLKIVAWTDIPRKHKIFNIILKLRAILLNIWAFISMMVGRKISSSFIYAKYFKATYWTILFWFSFCLSSFGMIPPITTIWEVLIKRAVWRDRGAGAVPRGCNWAARPWAVWVCVYY